MPWLSGLNVTHTQLRGVLRIWNKHVPLPPLPSDPRTILETPKNITIKNDYWHRGLKCALFSMLKKNKSDVPNNTLSLKINTDGITVLKSSAMECWPLLCEIKEFPEISPEVIGLYCGRGKPNDIELYFRDFVDELKDCMENGQMYNDQKLNINLHCFIADSPARAFMKS